MREISEFSFQHLKYPCHPEESSLHRLATIKQLLSRDQLSSQSDLVKALSNQGDKDYPVFRSGSSPDYLGTGSTGNAGMFSCHYANTHMQYTVSFSM